MTGMANKQVKGGTTEKMGLESLDLRIYQVANVFFG